MSEGEQIRLRHLNESCRTGSHNNRIISFETSGAYPRDIQGGPLPKIKKNTKTVRFSWNFTQMLVRILGVSSTIYFFPASIFRGVGPPPHDKKEPEMSEGEQIRLRHLNESCRTGSHNSHIISFETSGAYPRGIQGGPLPKFKKPRNEGRSSNTILNSNLGALRRIGYAVFTSQCQKTAPLLYV